MTSIPSYLSYSEPSITTILILTSFLILSNLINAIFNKLVSCGLIGQILLGIAYGTPGLKRLDVDTERVIVNLGYLGLILLVYEGGLSTNFRSMKANLAVSTCVAATGICLPIGLSFIFVKLANASALQAFAAGAALCSTSLGTTFSVLDSCGLVNTRVGIVLSSAAMMDDVVGLVMVQVISNLGDSSNSFGPVAIIRPVFVSLAFAVLVPFVAYFMVKPITLLTGKWRQKSNSKQVELMIASSSFVFVVHTIILLVLVTGSSYAGTSNLFASYLAGASISWWDSEVFHTTETANIESTTSLQHEEVDVILNSPDSSGENVHDLQLGDTNSFKSDSNSGKAIFNRYYAQSLQYILKPFFFASIGFSIPITQMFSGSILWRGIIYSILMFVGKLACGLWLVRLPKNLQFSGLLSRLSKRTTTPTRAALATDVELRGDKNVTMVEKKNDSPSNQNSWARIPTDIERSITSKREVTTNSPDMTDLAICGHEPFEQNLINTSNNLEASSQNPKPAISDSNQASKIPPIKEPSKSDSHQSNNPHTNYSHNCNHNQIHTQSSPSTPNPEPSSLYQSLILGTAMTARGEIGFLISSLAQQKGIFNSSPSTSTSSTSSPIFLIITWAIVLCTIIGPIGVGILSRLDEKSKQKLERDRLATKDDR